MQVHVNRDLQRGLQRLFEAEVIRRQNRLGTKDQQLIAFNYPLPTIAILSPYLSEIA